MVFFGPVLTCLQVVTVKVLLLHAFKHQNKHDIVLELLLEENIEQNLGILRWA